MKRSFLLLLIAFLCQCSDIVISVVTLQNPLTGYINSCYKASNLTGSLDYCGFAKWGAGALFSTDQGFTVYQPNNPVGVNKQDQLAQLYSAYLLSSTTDPSSNCLAVISWFSCTYVFPYCPIEANSFSAVSYLSTCRIHCDQVNSLCGLQIDCSSFKSTNCALYVPDSYTFLPPDRGPYGAFPVIYGVFAGIWFLSTIAWLYFCFTAPVQPNTALLKLITSIYFTRVGLAVTLCLFWIDCNTIEYFCTSTSTSNSYSVLRLLESYQFFALFLLARGWMVTRVSLTNLEWIAVYFSTIVYLVCCFTLTNIANSAPSKNWIVYTTVVYTILYAQILVSNLQELQLLRGQLSRLGRIPGMMQEIYEGIVLKYGMFSLLLGCFFLLVLLEILCEVLFVTDLPIQSLALTFEIASWINVLLISYLFRPRKYSPFFFVIPVVTNRSNEPTATVTPEIGVMDNGTTLDNPHGRLPPLVVVKGTSRGEEASRGRNGEMMREEDDGEEQEEHDRYRLEEIQQREDVELELAPLLGRGRRGGGAGDGRSLVVMNKADGSVEVGIHSRDILDQEGGELNL